MPKSLKMKILALGAGGLLANGIAVIALLAWAERLLEARPPSESTFAVFYGDKPEPGSFTLERLQYALSLSDSNSSFITIGGYRPLEGTNGACDMARWLVGQGVASNKVFVDRSSYDSKSNLHSLARISEQHPTGPIVIITDKLHALRIRHLAPASRISSLPLLQTSGLGRSLLRGQQEVLAWLALLLLPDANYEKLVTSLRQQHGPEEAPPCTFNDSG